MIHFIKGFLIGFIIVILLFILKESYGQTEKATIIGCINTRTLETREPNNGNCLLGQNWQNIMLPPTRQLKVWKDVFDNDRQIINRLPIVNFESGFDEYAGNRWAYGYVQTLRSYKISPEIKPQLEWMKYRQESQKNGNCSHWKTEDRLMRCLYARHYGALSGYHWYPNKLMVAREYYYNYFLTK